MRAKPDVLIVGAGVSGLACGRALADAGLEVRLLDKSRGLGGRCATRRVEGQPVDHGLAFYHGDDPQFLAALDRADAGETLEGWPRRVHGEGAPCQPRAFRRGERRLAFRAGVTAFPKALARGLEVARDTRARTLRNAGDRIRVETDGGDVPRDDTQGTAGTHEAPTVVLALPAPQALELLRPLGDDRSAELRSIAHLLSGISSVRCLTLIAGYPAGVRPEWEMAYPEDSEVLQLVSHDSSKRDDPAWTVLVLQGKPCWSHRQWDAPEAAYRAAMLDEAARLCGDWAAAPEWTQTQRWRFARLGGGGDLSRPLLARLPGGGRLGFAGEAFAWGGGVQAAWRSGTDLAARILRDGDQA